jgi:ABC-type transporter Mla MlaB component
MLCIDWAVQHPWDRWTRIDQDRSRRRWEVSREITGSYGEHGGRDAVVNLCVAGDMCDGGSVEELAGNCLRSLDAGTRTLVLNCSAVHEMDTKLLAALVVIMRSAVKRGATVEIKPSTELRCWIEAMRIEEVLFRPVGKVKASRRCERAVRSPRR